jgi:hypothetical protein
VRCHFTIHGAVSECIVTAEAPTGQGFADAALAMLAESRDNPSVELTAAQTGESVAFEVTFKSKPLTISPNLMGKAHRVEPPRVLAYPSDVDRYYPMRAVRAFDGGSALVTCVVTLSRSLADCEVAAERPPGEGFGEHAIWIAENSTVVPLRCDGKAVGGAKVTVPVVFDPPSRRGFTPH